MARNSASVLVVVCWILSLAAVRCQFPDQAEILPSERDSVFLVHTSVQLNCSILPQYAETIDIQNVYFTHAGLGGNVIIREEWMDVISDVTLMLRIPGEYVTIDYSGTYNCFERTGWWPLAQRTVSITEPPPSVEDLNCVTSDMQSMTCDFCSDVSNADTFSFSWLIPVLGRSGDCSNSCSPDFSNADFNCYFLPAVSYNMSVVTSHQGMLTSFPFHLTTDSSIVKPEPVTNLVVQSSVSSINVTWDYPRGLDRARNTVPLTFTVQIRETTKQYVRTFGNLEDTTIVIGDLPPATVYNISVTSQPKRGGFQSLPTHTLAATLTDDSMCVQLWVFYLMLVIVVVLLMVVTAAVVTRKCCVERNKSRRDSLQSDEVKVVVFSDRF